MDEEYDVQEIFLSEDEDERAKLLRAIAERALQAEP